MWLWCYIMPLIRACLTGETRDLTQMPHKTAVTVYVRCRPTFTWSVPANHMYSRQVQMDTPVEHVFSIRFFA